MMIIGVDYHPSDQYIAFADTETGECGERRLNHSNGEAEKFYRELAARRMRVRVGMEATGYSPRTSFIIGVDYRELSANCFFMDRKLGVR